MPNPETLLLGQKGKAVSAVKFKKKLENILYPIEPCRWQGMAQVYSRSLMEETWPNNLSYYLLVARKPPIQKALKAKIDNLQKERNTDNTKKSV